ncbi:SWI/SNF-related matrix-associated actin-dependent regulator of chromatin subfamily A-like protein 1 isoform X1 [Clavelina lepadiformis]|uniref:SWI/SNF-related matrix-associated actin-dependent regulator of chromatin subfamily A-like protein 1 isoform X1 n=1 Tax=Clavelina lepadiformis TaxID=159417 RepID=UPI004041E67D
MSNLTEAQLKRIEENRQRALFLKSKKNSVNDDIAVNADKKLTAMSKLYNRQHSRKLSTTNVSAQMQKSNNAGKTTLSCQLTDGDRFTVTCKYDPKLVIVFKSVSSRRFDPETKIWSFDVNDHNYLASKLNVLGFNLPQLANAVLVNNQQGGFSAVPLNSLFSGTCYLISQDRFEIDVQYNAFCVGVFKTVPSRIYDPNTRRWNFNLTDYKQLFSRLKEDPQVSIEPLPPIVNKVFKDQILARNREAAESENDLQDVDQHLVSSLMPFQRDGVNFAISRNGRILLADDMGLGKTVQSICVAAYYQSKWPLLIICPSSVRLMWKEALLRWLPSRLNDDDVTVVLTGRDVLSHSTSVTVITYDLLTKHQKIYEDKKFQVAILDESHFIKNFKTARSRAVAAVLRHSKHVLLLSGTPALSRPAELYTQISLVRPDLFPVFHHFGMRYCAGKQNPWGWEFTGSSNMEELRLILQETVMLRRTKDDVLSQLPPKLRRSVAIDVSSMKRNLKRKRALDEAQHAVEKKGISAVERRGLLLQYFNETAHVKLDAVKSYILDLLEGGHKFLLFAHHKLMLNAIAELLEAKGYEYIRIDGSTPSDRRQSQVARFQENYQCKVALLSITAANMGITLHSASLVVFAELFWNPGILVQAEDRCYRIGQRDVVNIHYLVAKGTADDYIWEMIKKKLDVLSKAGLNGSRFDDTQAHAATPTRHRSNLLDYFKTAKEESNENKSVNEFAETLKSDEDSILVEALELAESQSAEFVAVASVVTKLYPARSSTELRLSGENSTENFAPEAKKRQICDVENSAEKNKKFRLC